MKLHLFFGLILMLSSCGNKAPKTAANLPGFEITSIPGTSDFEKAIKKDAATGAIIEEGELYQGRLSGTWVKYNIEKQFVETISTFVDGKRTGLYLEFNNLGRIQKQARYSNDELDGLLIQYSRNVRKEKEANYRNGKLDGVYREYNSQEKLIKEINYEDGMIHGKYRYFDEEGNVTVEYDYKNNEKVGGGAVQNSK